MPITKLRLSRRVQQTCSYCSPVLNLAALYIDKRPVPTIRRDSKRCMEHLGSLGTLSNFGTAVLCTSDIVDLAGSPNDHVGHHAWGQVHGCSTGLMDIEGRRRGPVWRSTHDQLVNIERVWELQD
jgi:hypothetical protein